MLAAIVILSSFIFKKKQTVRDMIYAAIATVGMVLVSAVIESGGQSADLKDGFLGLGTEVIYASVILLNTIANDAEMIHITTIQLLIVGKAMITMFS